MAILIVLGLVVTVVGAGLYLLAAGEPGRLDE